MLNCMTMTLGALAALSLVALGADGDKDSAKLAADLDGTWAVVGHSHNGRVAPKERLEGMKFIFAGEKLKIRTPSATTEHRMKLDRTTKPESVVLTGTDRSAAVHREIFQEDKGHITFALDMKAKAFGKADGV